MHVEIIHQIINAARTSSSPLSAVFSRRFDNVVYIRHSYRSFIGASLGNKYPADADAIVLTGYSTTTNFTDVIEAHWASAVAVNPARFAGVARGYLTMAQEADRTGAFYASGFDPAIPPVDFAFEDTVTDGEFGALGAVLQPSAYPGPLMVVTGDRDAFFCQPPVSHCEAILAQTRTDFFPNVVNFNSFAPQNTGHDLTLHYTAPQTFSQVHEWLDRTL